MQTDLDKILFITLSCVGDAVMSTSVLQSLHESYPDAKIDIVADKRSDDIFKHCPYKGKIIYKDKNKFLRGSWALIKQLLPVRYDLIVDIRTDGLAYLLNAKKRLTKLGAKTHGLHAVETMMGIIDDVHGSKPIPTPCVWLDKESQFFAEKKVSIFANKNIIAIGPGCSGKRIEKFWPTEKYAQLANEMNDVFDAVVLLGGPMDKKLSEKIEKELNLPCLDMCGRTDLLQAAALIKKAKIFIGSDSGLGHLAAAVETPTLSFFSVDRPERCLPWGTSASWLMGKNKDARNISVEEARNKIHSMLSL
jgi:heptosyltransferase III